MRIILDLDEKILERLAVLGDTVTVISRLVDHAQQGVYRPMAWERGWLEAVFGVDWQTKIERDPDTPNFDRPKQ